MFDFPQLIEHPAAPCPVCGQTVPWFSFGSIAPRPDCRPCEAADKARRALETKRLECLTLWRDITPANMAVQIERRRLSPALLPAMELDGTKGAALVGTCGAGKTRVGYYLLKKAANAGLKPFTVTSAALREAASQLHADDKRVRHEAAELLAAAERCGALLLDDVGKGASTPRGDEVLYDILDTRLNRHRVTFWTANAGYKHLVAQFGPDRGPAIGRRLLELAGREGGQPGRIFNAIETA